MGPSESEGRPDAAPADQGCRRAAGDRGLLRLKRRPGSADRRRRGRHWDGWSPSSALDGPQHGHRPGPPRFLRVEDRDVVDISAAETMAPDGLVLITTGTQGEPLSALSRMSRSEHRSISITADDLIILSSSLIRATGGGVRRHRRPVESAPGGHQSASARACLRPAYAGSCCSSTTAFGRAT